MLSIKRRQERAWPSRFYWACERWDIAGKWPPILKVAIDQYCERPSKGSQQNPKHKRNKLTTYVTMADSCKTIGYELCVACQKKHSLDKW